MISRRTQQMPGGAMGGGAMSGGHGPSMQPMQGQMGAMGGGFQSMQGAAMQQQQQGVAMQQNAAQQQFHQRPFSAVSAAMSGDDLSEPVDAPVGGSGGYGQGLIPQQAHGAQFQQSRFQQPYQGLGGGPSLTPVGPSAGSARPFLPPQEALFAASGTNSSSSSRMPQPPSHRSSGGRSGR
jgi:hypothetical protein